MEVTDMKYNRSEIMKAAWELRRSYFARALTFAECLKRAWAKAKEEMTAAAEMAKVEGQKFADGMEITFDGYTAILRRWVKGNHDRIYLNVPNSRKNYGYVDLKNQADCTINVCWSRKMAQAILSMAF